MGKNEGEKQLTAAYYYSYVRYIMNFYTLYTEEREGGAPGFFPHAVEALIEETKRFTEAGCDFEELCALRESQLSVLNFLIKIGDWLQIHRYAMFRTGRRLGQVEASALLPPGDAADILMNFIMEGENPLEINQRIQSVIGELPVRFTKNKFYSVIEDSLKPYLKRDRSDLDKMMGRIRDAAALDFVKDGGSAKALPSGWFPDGFLEEISEMVQEFERCDYQRLTLEHYGQMESRLSDIDRRTTDMTDQMLQLTELLNDLMVMVLSSRWAEELPLHSELRQSLLSVNVSLEQSTEIAEEQLFGALEGRQEYFWANYLKYLGRGEGSSDRASSSGRESSEACFVVEQLLSGSFAAPLFREKEPSDVAEAGMEEVLTELFGELEQRLKRAPRFTGRAVMAGVLSVLPVWFNSLEEVESYIKDSFSLCLDMAEKEACFNRLEQIMVVQNALV